jgi:hypothetical protein
MSRSGWHLDAESLLPVVSDIEEFRRSHADDPALAEVRWAMKERMLRFFVETGDVVPHQWDPRR